MLNSSRLFLNVFIALLLCILPIRPLIADTWQAPTTATYRSENASFEVVVTPARGAPRATLRQKDGQPWITVWDAQLINKLAPVSAMVHDSGRYVVTFDEWSSVGEKPVVIYGKGGHLVAELKLADLNLERHRNIEQSVSSYWWNQDAIMLFGPSAEKDGEPWQRTLENSLFIRLYWGEVLAIDLADGKLRDDRWWNTYPKDQKDKLQKATSKYLDAAWHRLAGEYLRKSNFDPDPRANGAAGILLASQLHLREALPLLRELAATKRFRGWAAPRWMGAMNLQELAQIAIAEIEKSDPKSNLSDPSTRLIPKAVDPDPFLTTRPAAKSELVLYEMLMVIPVDIHYTVSISTDGKLHAVEMSSEHGDTPKRVVREGQLTAAQIEKLSRTLAQCERLPSRPMNIHDAVINVRYHEQTWSSDHRCDAAIREIAKLADSFPAR